jgi:hypothetical protein
VDDGRFGEGRRRERWRLGGARGTGGADADGLDADVVGAEGVVGADADSAGGAYTGAGAGANTGAGVGDRRSGDEKPGGGEQEASRRAPGTGKPRGDLGTREPDPGAGTGALGAPGAPAGEKETGRASSSVRKSSS